MKKNKNAKKDKRAPMMDMEDFLNELEAEVKELQKKIDELERQYHTCSKCGNIIRPSHYADGC